MSELACGIVGLPNVGKSTLFNALTGSGAGASNFPFCTIEPNVGVVAVPDARLEGLANRSSSAKIIPASMRFVDIAGLVKGASSGEGLGNKFLANIRDTDAIIQVIRCFDDDEIIHVQGRVNPVEDAQIIELELAMADLQMVENIMTKMQRQAKSDPKLAATLGALKKAHAHLNNSKPMRQLAISDEELALLSHYNFLTAKPMLYVANVDEASLQTPSSNPHYQKLSEHARQEGAQILSLCAQVEEQISQLGVEERPQMLELMGMEAPGLERLIACSFELLGLITYLTTGPQETRAWTIKQGTLAPAAAGKIHSDIERGFIRAEVIEYSDYITLGRQGSKDAGKARIEGKEYIVQDGDVILFYHAK